MIVLYVRIANATYATLSLAIIYYGLLLPEHYDGVVLPLLFQANYRQPNGSNVLVTTNTVSISFIPLPPPIFTVANSVSCDRVSSGLANYTGCVPGLSRIFICGHYLYNLSAMIGSVPCAVSYTSPSRRS